MELYSVFLISYSAIGQHVRNKTHCQFVNYETVWRQLQSAEDMIFYHYSQKSPYRRFSITAVVHLPAINGISTNR